MDLWITSPSPTLKPDLYNEKISNGCGSCHPILLPSYHLDLAISKIRRCWIELSTCHVDNLSIPSIHATMGFSKLHEDSEKIQPSVIKTDEIIKG